MYLASRLERRHDLDSMVITACRNELDEFGTINREPGFKSLDKSFSLFVVGLRA